MTEIETSRQNLSEQLQRVAEIDPIVNAVSKIRFPSERDMLEAMVVELAKDRQRLVLVLRLLQPDARVCAERGRGAGAPGRGVGPDHRQG